MKQAALSEVVDFVSGGTPSKANDDFWHGTIPWVSPKDMKSEVISATQDWITDAAVTHSATKVVPPGSVLVVARSGILAHTLPVAMTASPTAFNQDVKALLPHRDVLSPDYLFRVLQAMGPDLVRVGVKKGATVHSLRSGVLEGLRIPLPSLPEQRRIAALLTKQMAAVGKARAAVQAQLEAAKALTGAYLREVFESEEAGRWPRRRLGEVAHVSGGIQKSSHRLPVAFHRPYLTVRNVGWGKLDLSSLEHFEVTPTELERLCLHPGDVLVVEGNGSTGQIGRVAVFRGEISECIHQNHLIRVRPNQRELISDFLFQFLSGPDGRTQLMRAAGTTTGLRTLSVSKIQNLDVPLPSLESQVDTTNYLGRLAKRLETLQNRLQEVDSLLDPLGNALLRVTFKGGL